MEDNERGVKRKSRLAVFEHVEMEKASKKAQFEANPLEYEEYSASESELIIDEENTRQRKKKNPLIKLSNEQLNMRCQWKLCDDLYDSWEKFNSHLMEHAAVSTDHLLCQWAKCDYKAISVPFLMQHLSYHGYLSKLTNIGQNIVDRDVLPRCNQKEVSNVPVDNFGYTCEWENCSYNFYTIYDFLNHVVTHATKKEGAAKDTEKEVIRCCWTGCETTYSTMPKLSEHLRTHTKEKTVRCPTCFTLFSSKTKFCDHRRRQQSNFIQSYQCSQCLKLFPSERLLRDHIRSHINHYKCTMCDMTCSKPSLLAKHIRFKHVKDKPYTCSECDKTFVAKYNLDTHMKIHEDSDPMKCDMCNFSCRTKVGLDNHYVKKHDASCIYLIFPRYDSKIFLRYRKDQDGIYRLQTVRLESLEVTQEVIRSESMPTNKVNEGVRYLLNYDNGKTGYVLSISETNEQTLKPAETVEENNILITIQDVDEHGNVLKSQIVQQEIVGSVTSLDNAVVIGEVLENGSLEESSNFNSVAKSETSALKSCKEETNCEDDAKEL
nr:histone H4 transcription factor [Leptinotarsa decemlineata]